MTRSKNSTKLLALLMSLVLITSCFVGGTLARYITSTSSEDSARVAVWGINADEVEMDLFDAQYELDGTVVAKANDGDNIIAPGTGKMSKFSIVNLDDTLAPEVMYEIKINLDDTEIDERILNNPSIQWKLDSNDWGTWESTKADILALSGDASGVKVYAPNEIATEFANGVEHTISWQWLLDNNNDVMDTDMGNEAVDEDITAKIVVKVTARQVQEDTTGMLETQIFYKNAPQPLTFRSVAPINEFLSVEIDGIEVADTNYTKTEGSTIITLNENYLSTLEVGTYEIKIISESMTMTTSFMVENGPIVITSNEQMYALSRILHSKNTTNNKLNNYNIENDFSLFNIPEVLTTEMEKREYLQSASYILDDNINLQLSSDTNSNFFLGIGSNTYPFKGEFDGNNKSITLSANSGLSLNTYTRYDVGVFANTQDAKISNLNVNILSDILIKETAARSYIGALIGYSTSNTTVENCSANYKNSNFGIIFDENEDKVSTGGVGGLIGFSVQSTFKNCKVETEDSTLLAKAVDNPTNTMYALFSVGGILGVSSAGSDNTNNIGRIGNKIYNCSFTSNNSTQRDIILAEVQNGQEMVAGGIVGMTYNNALITNTNVNIKKGNIVAQKLGTTDVTSTYGTTVGGIIGRMEHTSELINCNVKGDSLNIVAKAPASSSAVGGIVGESIGAVHRDVTDVINCHFDGSNTSTIKLEITSADKTATASIGGIAGKARRIQDSTIKNVKIINNATDNFSKSYIGELVASIIENPALTNHTHIIPTTVKGIYNSNYSSIQLEQTANVKNNNNEIYQ